MSLKRNIEGKYVFSINEERPGVITSWEILDAFSVGSSCCDDWLLIRNIENEKRACCFSFYSLRIWDTPDPINYPLDEVMAGLAEIETFANAFDYDREIEDGDSPYGWLSSEGRFYSLSCGEHDKFARIVFNGNERSLELAGWVKVLYDDFLMGERWLTPEQAHWLKQYFDEEDVEHFCRF